MSLSIVSVSVIPGFTTSNSDLVTYKLTQPLYFDANANQEDSNINTIAGIRYFTSGKYIAYYYQSSFPQGYKESYRAYFPGAISNSKNYINFSWYNDKVNYTGRYATTTFSSSYGSYSTIKEMAGQTLYACDTTGTAMMSVSDFLISIM